MKSGLFCFLISLIILLSLPSCRKGSIPLDETNVISDAGQGTGTTTWTKNKEYILEGCIFVNPGQTLTIEAGTVIRGRTGQGEFASALIVARGGKIIAEGTLYEPIIYTDQDLGILVEKTFVEQDAYKQIERGNLAIEYNSFRNVREDDSISIFQVEAEPGIDVSVPSEFLRNYFTLSHSEIIDYGIGRINGRLNISPDSVKFGDLVSYPDSWFDPVTFKGAFKDQNWILGWTLLYMEGKIDF